MNKIFGIGLTKTGTHSLNFALNKLGFKSIHNCKDKQFMYDLRAGRFESTYLMKEYDALTHVEATAFFVQWDKAYPNSKFILTLRHDIVEFPPNKHSLDEWLNSCKRHEKKYWKNKLNMKTNSGNYYINSIIYGVHKFHMQRYRYIYMRHYVEVMDYFADRPDDLLMLNIQIMSNKSMSMRLCNFLNVEVNKECFQNKFINNL